jgi:hypothetical protein
MNTTILNYPGFQTLPKGVKKMLLVSEAYFFDEPASHRMEQRESSNGRRPAWEPFSRGGCGQGVMENLLPSLIGNAPGGKCGASSSSCRSIRRRQTPDSKGLALFRH